MILGSGSDIGSWDEAKLKRFIQLAVNTSVPSLPPSLTLREVKTTRRLVVGDEMELSPQAIRYLRTVLGL